MNLQDGYKIKGQYIIQHWRGHQMIDMEVIDNTTTKAGFDKIAGLTNENRSGGFKWLALDESSTAYTSDDTTLGSEATTAGMGRAAATCTQVTTTNASDTAQLVKTFDATGTITIKGAGIFDTSTADTANMAAASHFADKNLESGDSLVLTYQLQCGV